MGAANLPDDGGYTAKVLAEHFRLRQVAGGRAMPTNPPATLSTQAPVQSIPASVKLPAPASPANNGSDKVALLSQPS